tara:strand:+ start:1349 stop:2197 length:849 start_codon:yes stop_codon:yes gene_type:complete
MKILSFDIEEWWSYDYYDIGLKKDYLPRLNSYLSQILDKLEESNIRATFFCLGAVADKYPQVIRKIHDRGHHIGCHSFSHKFWTDATYKDFENDTKKALDILQNITGSKINAYRAPAFSVTPKNTWIFEILLNLGIKYDCSVFPASRSFGGFPNFCKSPVNISVNGGVIKEFPISIENIFGKELTYAGGGYFRLLPYYLISKYMKKNNYSMTYFHLSDFDKKQKKRFASLHNENAFLRYFKNYYGLNSAFSKFNRIVDDFDFISVEQADKKIHWDDCKTINY